MGKFCLGFNLIELLICIAISSVLSFVAIPAFNDYYQRRKMEANALQIAELFRYARTDALLKNRLVRICAGRINKVNVIQDCIAQSQALDWSLGAIAYFDYSGDAQYHKEGRIKRFKFANYGTNLINIQSDKLYYIHPDSTISSSTSSHKKFCFYLQVNTANNPLKGLLILEKYGNSRYCSNAEYNDCIKECQ